MPSKLRAVLFLALCLVVQCCGRPVATNDTAALLRSLIDPAKLATLGDRGANPRIQKVTAILWQAKVDGQDPAKVADSAVALIGWGGTEKGKLTSAEMVRNVTILERLGSTTPEDLDAMRHGHPSARHAGQRCRPCLRPTGSRPAAASRCVRWPDCTCVMDLETMIRMNPPKQISMKGASVPAYEVADLFEILGRLPERPASVKYSVPSRKSRRNASHWRSISRMQALPRNA